MGNSETSASEGVSIQSVVRAANMLKYIARSGNNATLKSISGELGLSHSTTHNILRTLKQCGFVSQSEAGAPYSLGYVFIELSSLADTESSLQKLAAPYMHQLTEKYNETANLAIFKNGRARYIFCTECAHEIRMNPSRGMGAAVHATAVGKVLLAAMGDEEIEALVNGNLVRITSNTITDMKMFMAEIAAVRAQGYAIDDGEFSETTRCFAAPIYNRSNTVIAAMSLSFPDNRIRNFSKREVIDDVVKTASRISSFDGKVL